MRVPSRTLGRACTRSPLGHVHRVEERLIEARLVLVGDDEDVKATEGEE
jgi:hypothetical protein